MEGNGEDSATHDANGKASGRKPPAQTLTKTTNDICFASGHVGVLNQVCLVLTTEIMTHTHNFNTQVPKSQKKEYKGRHGLEAMGVTQERKDERRKYNAMVILVI